MKTEQHDALRFHALFFAIAAPLLIFSSPPLKGWLLLGLALVYNVAIPWIGAARGYRDWVDLWAFLLPLSVLQIFPDWVLVELLEVLVFPDLGLPRVGPVPVSFAFMWITLLWPMIYFCRGSVGKAALAGLLLFGISEWIARPLDLWYCQGVKTVAGVALYVLLPEAAFAAGIMALYHWTRWRSLATRVAAAISLSCFYAGALVLSYLLMERLP